MEMAVNIAGLGCWQVASELIGGAVDVGEPLVGQGLDSLASMELRQKLQVSGNGLARDWQQNLHGPMVSMGCDDATTCGTKRC
jgi:aryl carrier-like protein